MIFALQKFIHIFFQQIVEEIANLFINSTHILSHQNLETNVTTKMYMNNFGQFDY